MPITITNIGTTSNGNFTSWKFNTPALSTASDGMIMIATQEQSNTSIGFPIVTSTICGVDMQWKADDEFVWNSPYNGVTYTSTPLFFPLPILFDNNPLNLASGFRAKTWPAMSTKIVNAIGGTVDAMTLIIFGVVGSPIPSTIFTDRGVPNGPTYFSNGSDPPVGPLVSPQWSTNLWNDLQIGVTFGDSQSRVNTGPQTTAGFGNWTGITGSAYYGTNYCTANLGVLAENSAVASNAVWTWAAGASGSIGAYTFALTDVTAGNTSDTSTVKQHILRPQYGRIITPIVGMQ